MSTQVRLVALEGGEIGGRGGIRSVGARAAGGAEDAVGAMRGGSRRASEGLGEVVAGCLGTARRMTTMGSAMSLLRMREASRCMLCLLETGGLNLKMMTKDAKRGQSRRVYY